MKVNGLEIEKVDGDGTPVVFLHGWLGSKESWNQVRQHLDLDNPMMFYSHRCHGNSGCEEFHDFSSPAKDIDQLLDELEIEKPIIVGHSMGGMTALKYAAEYDNFSGLFLIGTCASTPEPEVENPEFYLENFDSMDRDKWAEMITENYARETDFPAIAEQARKQLANAPDEPVIYGLKAMVNYDVRDSLDDMDAPSLVVAGDRDLAIKDHMTEELSEILGCERKVLDATHLMLQERPKELAELIEDFVENNQ